MHKWYAGEKTGKKIAIKKSCGAGSRKKKEKDKEEQKKERTAEDEKVLVDIEGSGIEVLVSKKIALQSMILV